MKKKEIRRKEDEFEIKCKHEARERERGRKSEYLHLTPRHREKRTERKNEEKKRIK